jgi:deazaflavin-dependent oxidoreductase (nitroreductase family)
VEKKLMKIASRMNVWVYRMTNGKVMGSMKGSPICLVTMTGRKSGRTITMPLIYIAHGEDVVLIASQGGAPDHPVWYHNLMANPNIHIQSGSVDRPMRVRQASDEEKAEIWPHAVSVYGEFDDYQAKTDRNIPLLICSPTGVPQ